MTKALDGCLSVFPTAEFQKRAEHLQEARSRGPRQRQAARTFFAGAVEIAPDKQGRVAIPQSLREYAGLDRDVIVAGNFDHIELWDSTRFRESDRVGTASIVEGEGIDDFA